jgi:hypothetical protein
VIKKILRSKLKAGYIIENQVKKDPGSAVAYKAFKVDKRDDDQWIEIRDAENLDLWGLVKRIETPYGALYLGFGLHKEPLGLFRPYKGKIDDPREVVKRVNTQYRFIKLNWCEAGGNLRAKLFNFRVDVIDMYNFVRFLSPLPADVKKIISKIQIT